MGTGRLDAAARWRLLGLGCAALGAVAVLVACRPVAGGGPDRDLVAGAADLA
ncbi:MAG: hypothetical protein JO222_00400 [Frankiales bacterium]|nr:hypothetical protein [Frankiales bacterium]